MNKNVYILLLVGIGVFFGITVLYFLSFFYIFPYVHDRTLSHFSENLINIPIPRETQLVDQFSQVGQQIANSDHCDYLVARMLKTNLSKEQIENYYKNKYEGKPEIEFIWLNENNKYTNNSMYDSTTIYTLKEWIRNRSQVKNGNVIIYIFEAAMTSSIDYRCS